MLAVLNPHQAPGLRLKLSGVARPLRNKPLRMSGCLPPLKPSGSLGCHVRAGAWSAADVGPALQWQAAAGISAVASHPVLVLVERTLLMLVTTQHPLGAESRWIILDADQPVGLGFVRPGFAVLLILKEQTLTGLRWASPSVFVLERILQSVMAHSLTLFLFGLPLQVSVKPSQPRASIAGISQSWVHLSRPFVEQLLPLVPVLYVEIMVLWPS
nr:uncharacterized protein LOC116830334 [Chelonoidis abingdonii]